jgi:hypothetical protein
MNISNLSQEQKEAGRKKSLGELGELFGIKALVDNKFEKIVNLNDIKMNYPFADLYAEKDGKKYVISIKARNKNQKNGTLNSRYKLGSNAYSHASRAEEKFDAEAYWMAVQFDEETVSIYFGSLAELNQSNGIPMKKCESGTVGIDLVKDKLHYFDFSYFKNKE